MSKERGFHYGMPTREQLIKELNNFESPKKLANDIGASTATIHKWMRTMKITKKVKYG